MGIIAGKSRKKGLMGKTLKAEGREEEI